MQHSQREEIDPSHRDQPNSLAVPPFSPENDEGSIPGDIVGIVAHEPVESNDATDESLGSVELASSKSPKTKRNPHPRPTHKKTPPKSKKPSTKALGRGKTTVHGGRKLVAGSYLTRGYLEGGHDSVCREVACEGLATALGYCRLHYIKNWKKIKRKEVILRERKLNQYIEELVNKYPEKYIEAIRQDLVCDKDFAKVIYDLDLDEGIDEFETEGGDQVDSIIDTIKREFEDDADVF